MIRGTKDRPPTVPEKGYHTGSSLRASLTNTKNNTKIRKNTQCSKILNTQYFNTSTLQINNTQSLMLKINTEAFGATPWYSQKLQQITDLFTNFYHSYKKKKKKKP